MGSVRACAGAVCELVSSASSSHALCSGLHQSASSAPQPTPPPHHPGGRVLLAASTTPAMVYSTSFFVLLMVACMFYLAVQLPSSVPMAAGLELAQLQHELSKSSAAPSTVPSLHASPDTAQASKFSESSLHQVALNTSSGLLHRLLSRELRVPPVGALPSYLPQPLPLQASPQAQIRYPTFTILAILPEENAPYITRALRDAQAKWEVSGHTSTFGIHRDTPLPKTRDRNMKSKQQQAQQLPVIRASDIPLVVYSEPANNDTERILSSVCEWIAVHNPTLVLSLLDKQRNFYASLAAQTAGIPFVSLTQTYRNEINTVSDDHQLEVSLSLSIAAFQWHPPCLV